MVDEPFVTFRQPTRFTRQFKYWSESWPWFLVLVLAVAPQVGALKLVLNFAPVFYTPGGIELFSLLVILYLVIALVYFIALFGLVTAFIPLLFRAPTIESWSRERRRTYQEQGIACFVAGLAFRPRAVTGLEGFMEDDDDVGLLSLWPDHLRFDGDSIDMKVPWGLIASVAVRRTGWRGLWVAGKDVHVAFQRPIRERKGFVLKLREGSTIFHARRRSLELADRLSSCLEARQRAGL